MSSSSSSDDELYQTAPMSPMSLEAYLEAFSRQGTSSGSSVAPTPVASTSDAASPSRHDQPLSTDNIAGSTIDSADDGAVPSPSSPVASTSAADSRMRIPPPRTRVGTNGGSDRAVPSTPSPGASTSAANSRMRTPPPRTRAGTNGGPVRRRECPYCFKEVKSSYQRRRCMDSHMRFQCTECSRRFSRDSSRRSHMTAHHGVQGPYVCSRCGRTFHRPSLLANHIKSCMGFVRG